MLNRISGLYSQLEIEVEIILSVVVSTQCTENIFKLSLL